MFDFFKKKKASKTESSVIDNHLYAPVQGELIAIEQVNDQVFSQKMMGDGFAVIPTDSAIYSPAVGTILSVFPTKHAIGIKMDNGLELLLHMGIDTVELKGDPFNIVVEANQVVTADTKLAEVDLEALKVAGKENTMMVIITNMDQLDSFTLDKKGNVTHSEVIGTAIAK